MAVVLKVTQDSATTVLVTNSPILGNLSSLPPGGTTGQALIKQSNANGDAIWSTVSGGGGGGSVDTVNGVSPVAGNVTLTKANIGLGNVPNTDTTNATNISTGTLSIARIPTGTSGSTVALGNHTHAIADITSLQTTLNAKANTGSNSDITALTGLTTAISVAQGGTGLTTYNVGDIIYASGSSTFNRISAVAVGNALISSGTGTAPAWGKISLTSHVSGTLPVANGGTGTTSFTTGDLLYASGTTTIGKLNAVATGNALISGGSGTAPSWGKVVLGTHTTGTLPTTSITDPANSNQGLDVTLTTFSVNGHTHDFTDIVTGSVGIGQLTPGAVIYVDKALSDYGAAGVWPAARPSSSQSVKVVWMGDTDPGSIALDRDIWYQTTS